MSVLVFPEGAWRELLTDDDLQAEGEQARRIERQLRTTLYYHEHLRDDRPIEAAFGSPIVTHQTGWGVEKDWTRPDQATGAAHYQTIIRTEADIERIQTPTLRVDSEATDRVYAETCELFDGLLTVAKQGPGCNHMAAMDFFAEIRGLEQVLWDLIDRPEWIHRAMEKLTAGHIARLISAEEQGALTLNNGGHYTGSGGVGYTSQLPLPDATVTEGPGVRAKDLWGHATTQIFSEVSPEMHEEFALQYERRFLSHFGLNCYGCCEALHNKMQYVKKIKNLRRVSISPFADVAKSAEALTDQYIYSYKPNPAILAGVHWDPAAARAQLREVLTQTRGCVVEIVMKDTHTICNEPRRMWEWVDLAREVADEFA